jgi:hypothetical protein
LYLESRPFCLGRQRVGARLLFDLLEEPASDMKMSPVGSKELGIAKLE